MKETTEPFLKRGIGFKVPFTNMRLTLPIFKKAVTGKEMLQDSPILLYISEEGEIRTFYNVTNGIIKPKDKWGREKGYENKIEARKIQYWYYNGERIPCYVHYEKEYYSYPLEPKIDAKSITKEIRLLQTNYKDYESKDAKMTREEIINAIYIAGAVVGIPIGAWYAGEIFGMWEALGWFGHAKPIVKEVIKEVIVNVTQTTPTVIP